MTKFPFFRPEAAELHEDQDSSLPRLHSRKAQEPLIKSVRTQVLGTGTIVQSFELSERGEQMLSVSNLTSSFH